ncbi:MAG TPA: hypothetical protein VGG00_08520 [Rhodanobacter sp.]|jgi:hypothetical protein
MAAGKQVFNGLWLPQMIDDNVRSHWLTFARQAALNAYLRKVRTNRLAQYLSAGRKRDYGVEP